MTARASNKSSEACGSAGKSLRAGLGSGEAFEEGLYRTPSRLAITYENVYRVPQNEICVVNSIGEGTFGEVVLATNEVFGRVAVKWLKVRPGRACCIKLLLWL